MKKRLLGAGVVLAAAAVTAVTLVTTATGGGKAGQILIGISAAKTGILGPYDLQAGQLFQLRIDEINAAGGVLGKKLKVEWIDTKSDKPTAATNAQELISKGAVAILTTCDFDFSFPATQAAGSKKVPGLSLCASSPKAATPAIVGPYGGSMGLGSDAEGAAMAEWARKNKPQFKRAWIVKDLSLEYSKATADYFKARWKELGGQVCGEDTFTGGDNLDLSSNVTRLRAKAKGCDVVFDGSWNPFGALYIRAVRDAGIKMPIITNASVNGVPVVQNNPKLSDFYALGFACLNTYCSGSKNPAVAAVNAKFKKKYGQPIGNHYALPGYELGDALVGAIKKAGSTDGAKIANALFGGMPIKTFSGTMAFTQKCHRPQPGFFTVEQMTNGKSKQIATWAVQKIPNIGDGSPCSGVPPKIKK